MPRTLRISERSARALAGGASETAANVGAYVDALRELNAALARLDRVPKTKPKSTTWAAGMKAEARARVATSETRAEARRQDIRTAVFLRAAGRCEGPSSILGNGRDGRCIKAPNQLAHAFGRGKGRMAESERNCMALCDGCAYFETHNQPSAAFWWEYRAEFFGALGYAFESNEARKRAEFVKTRSSLPAAPRVR